MQAGSLTPNQNVQHSITACQSCRDQKLRCSRERPSCARCERLQTRCIYPSPAVRRGRKLRRSSRGVRQVARPDQRGYRDNASASGAQETTVSSSFRLNNLASSHCREIQNEEGLAWPNSEAQEELISSTPHSAARTSHLTDGLESINISSQSYPTHLQNTSLMQEGLIPDVDQPPLPPRALGLSLLDIYFTRIYNASVLFCKSTLFQQYLDEKVPGVLLKALFALATLFLARENEDNDEEPIAWSELRLLSAYSSCGLPWAKSALREAMSSICIEPSLTLLQALHCLQLYLFGIGEPRTGHICLAMAYRSCDLLGYNKKIVDGMETSYISLESELQRRCFWACWISTCIVMEPEPYVRSSWQEASMIPLPAAISHVVSGHKIIMGETMDHNWCSSLVGSQYKNTRSPVAAALLVKMVGVWAKVQLMVRDCASSSIAQHLDSLQRLSRLATSVFDTTIANGDPENSRSVHGVESTPLVLFIKALYHQCQITLHSMVVPLFSGLRCEPTIDSETVKQSAEIVIEQVGMFEALLAPYMYGKGDATLLPPFVGYGAFITGSVSLAIEISCKCKQSQRIGHGSHPESHGLSVVKGTLRLLNTLRVYWRALHHSWVTLDAALQLHLSSCRSQNEQTGPHATRVSGCNPSETNPLLSDPLPSKTTENVRPNAHERLSSPTGPSHEYQGPLVSDRSVIEVDTTPQVPQSIISNDYDLDQFNTEPVSTTFTTRSSIVQDDAWYNLSFAEAGVEEFAGFGPLHMFQQGWRIFS
ncbi:uncharacterized protein BDW43DRAFT_247250 [Aspergillus alliaceus]|uniref:uncharacterized protein n=1 Tax=Petromyces alliaceus TaxID=209559 RepID=UPI0012A55C4F|nr:uncharacterized protein BDW43DRAFT_247250 [Aspergillus alliaceus]KAB8227374.1 hypothetical protein BDW43DRAFT_247250 [Aspergillus alliaceus]